MLRKKLLIGILCVGLPSLMGSNAMASWPTFNGLNFAINKCIDMSSDWKRIGNTDQQGVYIEYMVNVKDLSYQCMNFGGGVGGEGRVFDLNSVIVIDDQVTEPDLDGHGHAESQGSVSDQQLYETLLSSEGFDVELACVNPNWSIIPPEEGGSFVVNEFQLTITGYVADKKTGVYDPSDSATFYCTLGEDNYYYDCLELGL